LLRGLSACHDGLLLGGIPLFDRAKDTCGPFIGERTSTPSVGERRRAFYFYRSKGERKKRERGLSGKEELFL